MKNGVKNIKAAAYTEWHTNSSCDIFNVTLLVPMSDCKKNVIFFSKKKSHSFLQSDIGV